MFGVKASRVIEGQGKFGVCSLEMGVRRWWLRVGSRQGAMLRASS